MTSLKRFFHHPWVQVILYILLIAVLTYLFLWRLWAAAPEDRAYLPDVSDLAAVFYPPRHFFAKALAAGQFPLWNPHIYSGYPQFADPQAATFYPIALILALAEGASFSMATIAFDIGLHYFLVGAFTFLFFRHILKSNLPALLGALVFEFGGYLTFYPPLQLSELEVVAWMPLTLLLLTLSIERRSWLLLAISGITMGTVFLAGRPQSYLTIGLITISWFVYTAYQAKYSWTQIATRIVVFGGFALGMAAAQWLPTLQLTRLSTRSVLIYEYVAEGGFPFMELTGFFVPQLLGSQNLYVGLLTLLLAGIAIIRREGMFWVGILLVGLLISVGDHLILFDSLYLVERLGFPGYLRNVERLAFGITFSLAALSGYGLRAILQNEIKPLLRPLGVMIAGVFIISLVLAWFWSFTRLPAESLQPITAVEAVAYAGMMMLIAFGALWLLRDQPKAAAAALVAIAVIDVMSMNQGRFFVESAFLPGNDIERVAEAPPIPEPVYRVAYDKTFWQDFGSVVGVDTPGGMPPLMLKDYEKLREILDVYRRNILLNVGMVVTTGLYDNPAFELVGEQDGYRYYRFLHFKPRAYLVEEAIEVADAEEAVDRLAPQDFDYWNKALVIGETGLGPRSPLQPTEKAAVVQQTPNAITIEATAVEPRLLVVSDTYYPGWQATIDDQPVEILQTNVALRGVIVPPGTHTITMTFRPITFYLGVTISLLTLLVVLVWSGYLLVLRYRERD